MVALERIKRAEAEEEAREANLEKEALRSALRLVERQTMETHSRSSSQAFSPDRTNGENEDEAKMTHSRSSSNVAMKSPGPNATFGEISGGGGSESAGPTSPVKATGLLASSVPASPAPPSPAPLYVPPPREDREEGTATHRKSLLGLEEDDEVEAELGEPSDPRVQSPATTPKPSSPSDSSHSSTAPISIEVISQPNAINAPMTNSNPASSAGPPSSPLPLPHPQLHRDRAMDRARSPSPALLSTNFDALSVNSERKRVSSHKQPAAPPPSAVSEGTSAPWENGDGGDDEDDDDGRELTFSLANEGLEVESPWADR